VSRPGHKNLVRRTHFWNYLHQVHVLSSLTLGIEGSIFLLSQNRQWYSIVFDMKHHCDLLPMQSVPITTNVASSNLDQGEVYNKLCDKVCQWLATGQWFSPGPRVSSTNKTDRHDITEILLKVALNTIKPIIVICRDKFVQ
jgi:hypothetical protein